MSQIKYTKDHETVTVAGDVITIGITDYAKNSLGDLVFIELPEIGQKVEENGEFAVVESVKIASEIYSPLAGEVVEVNSELEGDINLLQASVTETGWIAKIKVNDESKLNDLMNEDEYSKYISELD